MEEEMRSMCIHPPKLEDVPELIHRIQSLLGVRQAARTSALSKSWLYAWSTIPTLRFCQSTMMVSEEQEEKNKYVKLIDDTLQRYLRDNIPIEGYYHKLDIKNHEWASLAERWIRSIASKNSCLKVFNLKISVIDINLFTLPDEIFLCENLDKISVTPSVRVTSNRVMIGCNPVINCVSLRVLKLYDVNISEEVVDRILSTCTLLEKMKLIFCSGLKAFKVKKLRYLKVLTLHSTEKDNTLEIDDVPSLHLFDYYSPDMNLLPSNMVSLGSVITELHLSGVMIDNALLDMINSKLPLLVTLNLITWFWSPRRLNIKSASLKRLILKMREDKKIGIQVYAPKLLYFTYDGMIMPSLMFPVNAPEQIKLILNRENLFDHAFYVKFIEALKSSSKFDVEIIDKNRHDVIVPLNLDLDDLGRRVPVPATNVRKLSFSLFLSDKGLWEHSPNILKAFFLICHPNLIETKQSFKDNYHICQLMLNEMEEKKTSDLKDVEIENPHNGKWESIKDTWGIFFEESNESHAVEFKLNWYSP